MNGWVSLAERPEFFEAAINIDGEATAGSFMQHDEIAVLAKADRLRVRWPDYFLVLLEDDQPVARAVSIPFSNGRPNREELPAWGWDGCVMWAVEDALDGVSPDAAFALEINVDPAYRGRGVSGSAVRALREKAARLGLGELIAPVRPPDKASDPWCRMDDYIARTRADGLPVDRWLRVHVREGGQILGIAPVSMVVTGTLAQWRGWTGLAFDTDGTVAVPGGLVPVLASRQTGMAVYIEPNVWVRHET